MKKIILVLSIFCFISDNKAFSQSGNSLKSFSEQNSAENFSIVIHGGSGNIVKENISDSMEELYRQKLKEAIKTGHKILANGGSALKAVQHSINILEDSPLFNAGKGTVLTHDKAIELDASIMDGKTLNAGAVAGVTTIKNPINLAHEVMIASEHVLLAGKGAERFGKEQGIKTVDPGYFYTQNQSKDLQNKKNEIFGTVGCVALDKDGNLAAGTSTGGMTNKKYNRIGDSPIIGTGTYTNNKTCAVSATGWGEFFIRGVVAYDISAMMEYKGISVKEAARLVIHNKIPNLGGYGGIIALDHKGNISMEFNTAGMFCAKMNSTSEMEIKMYD